MTLATASKSDTRPLNAALRQDTPLVLPRHVPELDGLRAFAILPVLAAHSWTMVRIPWLNRLANNGWVGVDLFFVLSGFLITGILLDSHDEGSPHLLRNFYIRRALRIWPLYYALLAFCFLVGPHLGRAFLVQRSVYHWQYYAVYLQNLLLRDLGPLPLNITWSLAVEEQFYLTWPLLVVLFSAPRKALGTVLAMAIVISPALRFLMLRAGSSPMTIYYVTWCRLDGLAWGAVLALWMRWDRFRWGHLLAWSRIAAPLGLAAAAAVVLSWDDRHPARVLFGLTLLYAFIAVGFAGVLGLTLHAAAAQNGASRLLRNSALRYIGRTSYGLYLIHPVIFTAVSASTVFRQLDGWNNKTAGGALILLVDYAAVFAAAAVSWKFFEQPLLRLKRGFASRRVVTAD